MNNHQIAIEGYNRISAFLNGEKYVLPASFSAPPVQPALRVVKPLNEILDAEAAASTTTAKERQPQVESNKEIITKLLTPIESAEDVHAGEQPQVTLSAAEAAGRKVRTLAQVLNDEAAGSFAD